MNCEFNRMMHTHAIHTTHELTRAYLSSFLGGILLDSQYWSLKGGRLVYSLVKGSDRFPSMTGQQWRLKNNIIIIKSLITIILYFKIWPSYRRL